MLDFAVILELRVRSAHKNARPFFQLSSFLFLFARKHLATMMDSDDEAEEEKDVRFKPSFFGKPFIDFWM